MEPVNGVNSVSGGVPGQSAGGVALASFAAKISAGGDIASECMALMAEDSACQMRANLQGIRVQQRAVRQARKRRMELLKKQWAAKKKSGFWGKLGKIFSGVFSVLAGALSFFALPGFGVVGVGIAGAALSGGCKIASGAHASKAGKAAADALQAEQYKQIAQEAQGEMLQSLQDAAEVEKQMVQRITALVESETKSVVMK
jgi:hypothetical protein